MIIAVVATLSTQTVVEFVPLRPSWFVAVTVTLSSPSANRVVSMVQPSRPETSNEAVKLPSVTERLSLDR